MKHTAPWSDEVPDALRYPALSADAETDIVVIGGGMVGLLTAWELAQEGKRVTLLERTHIGGGDSGFTTGFLSRVPDISLRKIVKQHGDELLKDLFAATREAQLRLYDLIEQHGIACDLVHCDSFYGAYEADDGDLKQEWQAAYPVDQRASLVSKQDVPSLPFAQAIRFEDEGSFHVRKFLIGLADLCAKAGVTIHEVTEVTSLDWRGDKVMVMTKSGKLKASQVMLAVGNPSMLMPELKPLVKGRLTFVMAAKYATSPLPRQQYWDTKDPYTYFRPIDASTVIIGGYDVPQIIGNKLKPFEALEVFARHHLGEGFEMTHQWSGSLFETADGLPFAFEHPHLARRVFVATGFNGNGLVCGAMAARQLALLAIGKTSKVSELLSPQRVNITLDKPEVIEPKEVLPKAFVPLCRVDEIPPGKPVCKTVNGEKLVVFYVEGKYFAMPNACTHMGGPLCDGELENNIITCPWHGAKFDIRTGYAVGAPASRPNELYRIRILGGMLEIELPIVRSAAVRPKVVRGPVSSQQRAARHRDMLLFAGFALVLWMLEFAAQYFSNLTGHDLAMSLVRSFALTGATLIGLALFLSAIFKWWPSTAGHWRYRRYLGISGVVFIVFHVLSVQKFYFHFSLKATYPSLDPFVNPIVFGSFAFPIFLLMALTSSDWMMEKLTPPVWKNVHRLVYPAYLAAIFHFILMSKGSLYTNPPGQLLLLVTSLAVFGQLYWFFRIAWKSRFWSIGSAIGLTLILLALYGIWMVNMR